MTDCVTDDSGCITCPYIPAAPGVQEQVIVGANSGWNAGANWHEALDDDIHIVFTQQKVVGAVCGLKYVRDAVGQVAKIDFGFNFATFSSLCLFNVVERGVNVSAPMVYTPGDTFEIRRVGESVTYYFTPAGESTLQVHRSSKRSTGPMLPSACLFTSGDTVG